MPNGLLNSISLVIVLLAVLVRLAQRRTNSRASTISPTAELEAILKPIGATIADLVEARAKPNKRLRYAFDLTNLFVSGDVAVRRSFIQQASGILKVSHTIVCDKAYAASTALLSTPAIKHDFATCVQIITLHTVLDLLEADVSLLTAHDLYAVASGINTLWDQSKVGTPDPAILATINAHLVRWLPTTPFKSPLDILIPTWETLWRVVAITLAHVHADAARAGAFAELFEDPIRDVFSRARSAGEGNPEAVVLEVLRLHPPTNNIARAGTDGTIVKARISAAHRERSVWGERVDEFDPSRFMKPDHPPIYAFGYGPLTCIASKWAPMTAAVIVAAILKTAGEQNLKVIAGPQIGGRAGWDGWSFCGKT